MRHRLKSSNYTCTNDIFDLADGIVPITEELWFADNACRRIREFLCAVMAGMKTINELLQEIMRRHVTLRRVWHPQLCSQQLQSGLVECLLRHAMFF